MIKAISTLVCLTWVVAAVLASGPVPTSSEGWQIPDSAELERNPVPLDQRVLAGGQRIYKSKCQGCHGVNGKGDGPDADPAHAPGDLTDAGRASATRTA